MRAKYKVLCASAHDGIRNPFLPAQLKALVGELVSLLGIMIIEIERLKGEQKTEGNHNNGDL